MGHDKYPSALLSATLPISADQLISPPPDQCWQNVQPIPELFIWLCVTYVCVASAVATLAAFIVKNMLIV